MVLFIGAFCLSSTLIDVADARGYYVKVAIVEVGAGELSRHRYR